jgi:hypothetical protein
MAPRSKIPGPDGKLHEVELVKVKKSEEHTNTYELEDGTVLALRAIVTEVWKAIDAYDNEGNPQYFTKSGNIVSVTSPPELRRRSS